MKKPKKLTHVSSRGEARMVDVAEKRITHRVARAGAFVALAPATVLLLRSGRTPKGDVLATARIAGISAAKRTPEWIPLCHTVALTRVTVDLAIEDEGVRVECTAEALDRTGVEMEAMVGASAAALTLYDMLKAVERGIEFRVALLEKQGGKSGRFARKTPV